MTINAEQITIIGLLLAIGAAGLARKWVFGWVYEQVQKDLVAMTADRNFWRDMALQLGGITGKAVDIAEKKVDGA
jgi:hypothetical protein